MSVKKPYHLIQKGLTEGLRGSEKNFMQDWLHSDENAEDLVHDVERIWESSKNYKSSVSFDPVAAERRFRQKFDLSQTAPQREAKVISMVPRFRKLAIAASFALLFGAVGMWYTFFNNPLLEYSSGAMMAELTLPDDSKVWLKENSTIKYKKQFSDDIRNIELQGVAFFDVERDENRPFIITTENLEVNVLGTSFTVSDIDGDQSVAVEEGRVNMEDLKSGNNIVLSLGEKGISNAGDIQKEKLTSLNTANWRLAGLQFESASLTEVFGDLSDYYKIDFDISNLNTDVLNKEFTSTTQKHIELKDMMESIGLSFGLDYQIEDDKIILQSK